MQHMYHELDVLSKAVHFKNLSSAAVHVGLSQPQLSRIIAKLEEKLKVVLLDRTAKRKSGWTNIAYQLSEMFEKSTKRLISDISNISQSQIIEELRIGTLEGLSSFALNTCKHCFNVVGISKIFIEIFDLSELEANFLSGNLDIIFSSKAPGRQRYKYFSELGFQVLERIETNKNYAVLSSFEAVHTNKKELEKFPHVLVTNSLSFRKEWFKQVGGSGYMPTETKKGKSKEHEPVYMIGSDILNPVLWEQIVESTKAKS